MVFTLSLLLLLENQVSAEVKKVGVVFANDNVLVLVDYMDNYTIIDGYTGYADEGDLLHGEVEAYGYHNFYNLTKEMELNCYVDEFWYSRDEAIEWLKNRV